MSSDDTERVPLAERIVTPLQDTSAPRDREPDAADLEKLRTWQEARIGRKLRGEYESALLRLGELVDDNLDARMRIASVRVEGAGKTRPSFLHWLIEPHLSDVRTDASTLNDVLGVSKRISNKLLESDVFSIVVPRLEQSRGELAGPGDLELVLHTRPKGKYFLKTATEIGDQEGSVSVQGRIRNAFGGAEILETTLSSGLRTRLAGHVSISAPLTPSLRTRGELSVFGIEKDLTAYASCVEGIRGVRAAIKSINRHTTNEVSYEAALRHIHALTESASLSIREAAGHSVKSSLSHTWSYDSRDDKAIPSRGGYFRTYNELAGLGGDTAFLKSQASFQVARRLFPHSSISLSGRAGCLYSLDPASPPRFNDRFQLGGPLDVRMFKQSGLGPRDGSNALGGDLFWAVGLSVISDLPRRPQWPVKTHVFVNAGRLDTLNRDRSLTDNVRDSISKPCVSAGVGLLYRLDLVRVEVNFGVPLVANKTDAHRRGFQLGIGVEFL
ncbi:uncharacterized protein FOMMEDRAFT_118409 [Fomitiporia mediterranea MF3/22]|uniref:uncharacterized protein n=1 Tax=Fomitiporia mediterranea (strain MF3/22) TaxID=694068 RepID=UPI000440732D|nr:uncharacterized protein FOMMEDRAFT_118409 [Fomitiporia mediterranea MF3/22]EJD05373.1 hypothetical protein FOMMEDRAFT_118409 [Fomitiporia mediterranea MF3/22]